MPSRNRARDFDELLEAAPKDYDPENDVVSSEGSSDEEEQPEDRPDTSRAHYDKVSASKIRKSKDAVLGPQYRGSRISREEMMDDDEEDDDPFGHDLEEDDDSDIDMDAISGSEVSDNENSDEEESTEDTEVSGSDQEEDGQDEEVIPANTVDKAELRRAMKSGNASIAATISAANKADAEKGRAVKQQRATFDTLLNSRIKLQKALIATNSLVAVESEDLAELRQNGDEAIRRAEVAAMQLWSSLDQLRVEMSNARTGQKRKASTWTTSSSTNDLYAHFEAQESEAVSYRDATLTKWSLKSRGVSAAPQKGKLNNDRPTTIVDVLREQLTNTERSLKRARTPRSCAPVQLAKQITEDHNIYDDADFYGLLLKELLEAKSSSATTSAVNIDLSNIAKIRTDAKTKKNVDTKASKGRKLKYVVHEKLQNFCAPNDRTTWQERQTDDLFASLFGQSVALNEENNEPEDSDLDADAEKMLFRS